VPDPGAAAQRAAAAPQPGEQLLEAVAPLCAQHLGDHVGQPHRQEDGAHQQEDGDFRRDNGQGVGPVHIDAEDGLQMAVAAGAGRGGQKPVVTRFSLWDVLGNKLKPQSVEPGHRVTGLHGMGDKTG
jgi:hypothetical protein